MELGTSRRDLKKLCTLEPSHPDMQVEKTFLNDGEVSVLILDPNAFWQLIPTSDRSHPRKRQSSEHS